jgi:twitching motility protein PilT
MLTSGNKPYIKRLGEMIPLANNVLSNEQIEALLLPQLTAAQRDSLSNLRDVDFSHEVKSEALRFRVNVFRSNGGLSAVFRVVKNEILAMESLGLPEVVTKFGDLKNGLVLVGGPTGSGKSTTLAAIIDYINRSHPKHIITLEDPIEVLHTPKQCMINQREIGTDVKNFEIGMKHAVREDPDIILVGELRDVETFKTAIHAAETGHLVFGTIHAASASSCIGRILDLFPQEEHPSIRSAIAFNMKGIIAQKLLKSIREGVSRVPICEVMFFDVLVRKYVLEEQDHLLADHIKKSHRDGMQDFTMSLKSLIDQGLIDRNDALEIAPNREALTMALKGIGVT